MTGADLPDDRPVALRVTGGGAVSAEELAAIVVALTPVAAPVVLDEQDADDGGRLVSNWQRAALVEGLGGRAPTSMQDLVQGRFGLGHVGDPLRVS